MTFGFPNRTNKFGFRIKVHESEILSEMVLTCGTLDIILHSACCRESPVIVSSTTNAIQSESSIGENGRMSTLLLYRDCQYIRKACVKIGNVCNKNISDCNGPGWHEGA
jgi:hypothetical protein